MGKSTTKRDFPYAEPHCKKPEQLLRSPEFAQFLSFFNKVRHQYACLEMVIPEEVSNDPVLAEKVHDYYKTEEGARAAHDKGWKKFGILAQQTVSHVRNLAGQVFRPENGKNSVPPEWLIRIYPEFEGTLPMDAIREMERIYQQYWVFNRELFKERNLGMRMISSVMNNFYMCVANRGVSEGSFSSYMAPHKKIAKENDFRYSERIRKMTWREFYAEVDQVMAEKGLSAEKVRKIVAKKGGDWANFYLLPVFLELVRRGYKVYPDLSI